MQHYNTGPDNYLRLIGAAKRALSVPVIPSLNGYTPGGWTRIAKQFEQAGADAIELNIYFLATTPKTAASRWRSATSTWWPRQQHGFDTGRSKGLTLLQRHGEYGGAAGWGRRVRLVLFNRFCSPTYSSTNSRWRRIWCSPLPTSCASRCAGSPSCAAASRRALPQLAGRIPRMMCSSCCWPAPTAS